MEENLQPDYSLYSLIVSCLVILEFTQMAVCFKVVMFHGLTSCVSFDYVVNYEMMKIFQSGTPMSHKLCIVVLS